MGRQTHGHAHRGAWSLTFKAWVWMRKRCSQPTTGYFHLYGGRGIRVCERWQGKDGFANFLADMGEKPSAAHSLDRIDTNGDYEPGNCRWATDLVQHNNTRANKFIELEGKRRTIAEWAREVGVKPATIACRLRKGWSERDAVLRPLRVWP